MLKDKKVVILLIVVLLVIITGGIWLTGTKGLNYSLMYSKNAKLNVYIAKDFTTDEVKEIAKEVLGSEIYVQKNANKENIVVITAREISEEQAEQIIQKIEEKYEIEMNRESEMLVEENGDVKGRDIVFPYLPQVIISIMVIGVYFLIMYKKVGMIKVLTVSMGAIIGTQLLLLSVLAIFRIPINLFTMPISILVFLVTTGGITVFFEILKSKVKKSPKK